MTLLQDSVKSGLRHISLHFRREKKTSNHKTKTKHILSAISETRRDDFQVENAVETLFMEIIEMTVRVIVFANRFLWG